ncbi:hypothetical protein GCM10023322_28250 [Rugosimonospora acidiphila]|uniref:PPE family protein n=1 Tax=Rugosimonospora acidiphila TaxID=556531 RepID=A0ABP9RT28_9ACTN
MPDDKYYGYTPIPIPAPAAASDDYISVSQITKEAAYQPTQWDDDRRVTIDNLWMMVQRESDERVTATADMWRRVESLLETTGNNLRRYADALAKKWDSDAGRAFLQQVGRSLYSIDEWKGIAQTNAAGLDLLAASIKKNQEKAKPIWQTYVKAIQQPGSVPGSAPKQPNVLLFWESPESEGDRKTRLRKEYADKIKPYAKDLADTYMDVYFYHLSRGTKFKGPTDAAFASPPVPSPGALPPGTLPTPGVLPKPTLPKPTLPTQISPDHLVDVPAGDLPGANLPGANLPGSDLPGANLPGSDHSLTLAGQMGPMPQLNLPNVPNLPTVGPPPAAGPLPMPVLPSLPNVGEPPPSAPGEPRPLAGAEEPLTRPSMPGRPNLSGLRRPGQVRPPSPGRGTPNLRGARGRGGAPSQGAEGSDLSEEVEHPNARAPMPPRLGGRRAESGPRRPGSRAEEEPAGRGVGPRSRSDDEADRLAGRRRPGVAEEEQEAFRQQAGGRPDLEGRSATLRRGTGAEPLEEAGHGPALGGRSAPPPKARRSGGAVGAEEYEFVLEPDGDDQLWEVEQPAPTVIDTPHAPRPADPGPALGRPD